VWTSVPYAPPTHANFESLKMPRHKLHKVEAGRWKWRADLADRRGRGLLPRANNLIFYAGTDRPGEQIAKKYNKRSGPMRVSRPTSIHSMPSATGGIARLDVIA
jgi:hypothetical protein